MSEDLTTRRIRLLMAAGLGGMTVLHLVAPEPFEQMVPDELPGPASTWHWAAVATEATSAGLLARRSTARLGGWLAFFTFLGVWVANVEGVRQGGYAAAPGWLGGRTAAILRLPLQLPLLWWARRVAHAAPLDESAAG